MFEKSSSDILFLSTKVRTNVHKTCERRHKEERNKAAKKQKTQENTLYFKIV